MKKISSVTYFLIYTAQFNLVNGENVVKNCHCENKLSLVAYGRLKLAKVKLKLMHLTKSSEVQ